MSFTGNVYCRYCGDLIDDNDPEIDVCNNCFHKHLGIGYLDIPKEGKS